MVVTMAEIPVVFDVGSDRLVGIAAPAASASAVGVLILVGGRQYRAGSHRQFVLLARRLASAGYCAFRFDFRGMGDSSGHPRSFEEVNDDIGAAMAAFQAACPAVRRVVLWGLCDAATAAALYWWRSRDDRVTGLCLANPWLRSEAGLARTRVRHYYRERIQSLQFWRKLLRGEIGPVASIREYFFNVRAARDRRVEGFQRPMLDGLMAFPGSILLLLSERDLTAKEFVDGVTEDPKANALFGRKRLRRVDIMGADHTFSRQSWLREAEDAVLAWLADTAADGARIGTV